MARPSILNSIERKFILLIGDILIVFVCLNVFVNHAIDQEFLSNNLRTVLFSIGIVLFLILSYILDFYNLEKVSDRRRTFSQSIYITSLYVLIIFLLTIFIYDVSFWRIPLLTFLFLSPLEIALWRFMFTNVFKIIPVTKNVLYIYEEEITQDIKNDVSIINGEEADTYYKVKLTYSLEKSSIDDRRTFLTAIRKMDAFIINTRTYDAFPKELESILLDEIIQGKEVISYTSFYENVYEALPIKSRNDSFYEILQLKNRRIRYLHVVFSFFVNLMLTIFVGGIFVLVCPFVMFFNVFLNRGPLFYKQKRVGKYGKEFYVFKFRSMVVDAEKTGAKMATKNDARITPFGKILRKFRIDELPQILSVIRGDMQFIGPRPERKVFVEKLNTITPFYNTRHLIKPGITGWAQVKFKYGENLEDSIQKLEYDLYYIKNKSITMDLKIIFKTVTTILFSRGV